MLKDDTVSCHQGDIEEGQYRYHRQREPCNKRSGNRLQRHCRDGDGRQDLVVGHVGSSDISVLLGDGAGGFGEPSFQPASAGVDAVHAADLDGDGDWDLLATGRDAELIDVFLGDGAGAFEKQAGVAISAEAWDVESGDFDGDGAPDLVVSDRAGEAIQVVLSNP